jgi:hypothetical protein
MSGFSCVGTDFVIGRSPVQGVLPKCLKGFIVSEPEQARGSNP